MNELSERVLTENRKRTIISHLERGFRLDGRKPEDLRKITIHNGVMPNAEGSSLVELGETKVLAAYKITVDKPFPDRPKEGIFMFSAEFVPMAHPNFESGPPGEDSIELARVVDRGIRSAECIDVDSFFIEDEKVLALFGDLWILDHKGNLIDCSSIAAISGLLNTRVPELKDGQLDRESKGKELNPNSLPVSTTFVKIGNYWLIDPDFEEESCADTCITISTTTDHICSIQKRWGALSKEELMSLIDLSFKTGNKIRKMLKV